MKPTAVVFDVDGTLVDSERDGHRVAFNLAFAEAGLPDHWDVATYHDLLKVPGGRARLAAWFRSQGRSPEEAARLAEELHPRKTHHFQGLVAQGAVPARPGAVELVRELADAGVHLHVATTGSPEWVLPLLARHFPGCFEEIVTGADVAALKPDPEAYLAVLRRTGLDPTGVVAVEDSVAGVASAVAAGLACLVVRNEDSRDDDLSAAELVVDSYADPRLRRRLLGDDPVTS